MDQHGVSYKAFWETLLPQSNRRTGFSIRHAAKRNLVYFQLVGFQFTYMLDWVEPDATIAFLILTSNDACLLTETRTTTAAWRSWYACGDYTPCNRHRGMRGETADDHIG